MAEKHIPDPVDAHVGARLKMRRTLMGLSQDKLAEAVGVTFQQVQKYENGVNRVGASRLFNIGKVLGVTVAFFFEGYAPKGAGVFAAAIAEEQASLAPKLADKGPLLEEDIMLQKETIDLVKSYYLIQDEKIRKRMLNMIKSFTE